MNKSLLALAFSFLLSLLSMAQEPTLTGTVEVSVTKGTMSCDFTLTGIPKIKDYLILLNSGFNIRYFRNTKDDYNYSYDRSYNDNVSGESFGYFFPDNTGKSKFLPEGMQISYVGAFPVVSDTLKASDVGDWKGNIAFNGKTIRASEQCAWYPILYDVEKDLKYKKLNYKIEVRCTDCESIYLNGSEPVAAHTATFASAKPVSLMLFAGNYPVVKENDTYFLNAGLTSPELKEFSEMTDHFKKFYEKKLAIPYGSKITYIQTTPLSKKNSWLFVTYPSIVNVSNSSLGFVTYLDKKKGAWFKPYLAHEIAHYYFGTYIEPNSELGDMISEAFSEYMSLKAAREYLGDSVYNGKVAEKIKQLEKFEAIPVSKVKSEDDYHDRNKYVYTYFPVLLLAIEKEIGQEAMWKWLSAILSTKTDYTNYAFLKRTLETVVKKPATVQDIDSRYFSSDASIQNAVQALGRK